MTSPVVPGRDPARIRVGDRARRRGPSPSTCSPRPEQQLADEQPCQCAKDHAEPHRDDVGQHRAQQRLVEASPDVRRGRVLARGQSCRCRPLKCPQQANGDAGARGAADEQLVHGGARRAPRRVRMAHALLIGSCAPLPNCRQAFIGVWLSCWVGGGRILVGSSSDRRRPRRIDAGSVA